MIPIINILLIVGILLFILYNLYVDTRNWSNTGSFLEGMENASPLAEYMGAKGGYDFSSADEAKAKCEADGLQLCKKEEVIAGAKSKDSLQNVCSTGWTTDAPRGWYSVKGSSGCGSDNTWNTWAPPSGKGSAHCCKPPATDASKDTPAPSTLGSTQIGAGTANDAMEDQIKARAGNVAPMGTNVPQNCKKGCVKPTGPSGNCKVIQKDGAEKRECGYGCPVPTFERGDTVNCKYDKDCNSCGTVIFNPDDPPQMPPSGRAADGEKTNSWVGSRIDVPGTGIQNEPGLNPQGQMGQQQMAQQQQMGQQQMAQQQQMGQQQMGQQQNNDPSNKLGMMDLNIMDVNNGATVAPENNSLFNENIMKQVLEKKDLIPSDINKNNEETSYNLRIGKKFMINTASIRNFALPNIDNQDYIELGRIVKSIKMREKDPQEDDVVKTLYSKLNNFVLELLTDSSLDMSSYDNSGMPKQLNNKTRTTGMFTENSNSLITKTDTDKVEKRGKRQRFKPYNSVWSLYH